MKESFNAKLDKIFVDVQKKDAKRRNTKNPKDPMDKDANDAWNLSINPDDLSDRNEENVVEFPEK